MELYASGFNAWNQLCAWHHPASGRLQGPECHHDPEDLHRFARVLTCDAIEHLRSFQTHSVVRVDRTTICAGHVPRLFMDLLRHESDLACFHSAEASNGSCVTLGLDDAVYQWESLSHRLMNASIPAQKLDELRDCSQVVAYETGFAALCGNIGGAQRGSNQLNRYVCTWGDERYPACLGRQISKNCPANKPGLVTALQNLPTGGITKIAAGGYMLAALTTGNDLYLWGGHPGRNTILADVSDEPQPADVRDRDIADIAIGESHLIALTTQGEVFVIGENTNGQLGLSDKSADSWTKVELDLQDDRRIVGVAAGPRTSFLLVTKPIA